METRELTDMTAVLRAINEGSPSNAERWVNLTVFSSSAPNIAPTRQSELPPAKIGKSRMPKMMPGWPATRPKMPGRQRGKHRKMQVCGAGLLWPWPLHWHWLQMERL